MRKDPVFRSSDGPVAGLLGASAVALWFLIYDAMTGLPGRTPSVLGQAILFREPNPITDRVLFGPLLAYTVAHFAVFLALGTLVLWLVTRAERQRIYWFALLVFLGVFQVYFAGFLQLWSSTTAGQFPIWTVLVANVLATVVMLGYAFWRHPRVLRIFAYEVREGEYVEER